MEIILVRHGESIANTQSIYQGHTYDTDLSDLGNKQIKALAKHLSQNFSVIDEIIASPLLRTLQSAELISQGLLLKQPHVDRRLIEINHGDWEGKSITEVEEQFPEIIEEWRNNPEAAVMPNGETLAQVTERVFNFLEDLATQPFTRVIVVTHDLVIRAILTQLLLRQPNDIWLYHLDNGGYSLIDWVDKQRQVVTINVNEHLENIHSNLDAQAL